MNKRFLSLSRLLRSFPAKLLCAEIDAQIDEKEESRLVESNTGELKRFLSQKATLVFIAFISDSFDSAL